MVCGLACALEAPAVAVENVCAFCSGSLYSLHRRLETERDLVLQHLARPDVGERMPVGQAVGAVCVTGVGTTTAFRLDADSQLFKEQADDIRSTTCTIFLQWRVRRLDKASSIVRTYKEPDTRQGQRRIR